MALHIPKSPVITLSCPKHTRFNGSDVGAIKGGCSWCIRLVEIREQWLKLRGLVSQYNEDKRGSR